MPQLGLCGFLSWLFQIEKRKKDIEAQNNKKATMEARATDAEKKVQELNAKLGRVSIRLWSSVVLMCIFIFLHLGNNSWTSL